MKMKMDLRSFSFFLFVIVGFAVVPSESQETENENEFSYLQNSTLGPTHWGEIHKEWANCQNGSMQSPINIVNENVDIDCRLDMFQRSYKPAPAVLINRGHDIMMKWKGNGEAGSININGTEYALQQLHWHSPSEHSIDGRKFAMELHMVHKSCEDMYAVVSMMYKIGEPNSFLAEIEESIDAIKKIDDGEEEIGIIDAGHVKRGTQKYYRYIGSLTTPPCSESVVWIIVKKIGTVSKHQVELMRDAVHDHSDRNARPTQAINSRVVKLYMP